jgi:hypothetical protein
MQYSLIERIVSVETYIRKESHKKSVTGKLEYGFPVFQFLTSGK